MLAYSHEEQSRILNRLKTAHNSKVAKIRASFLAKENKFFKQHINNEKVLVAGSGLGHDAFYLLKFNKIVIGIEIIPLLVEESVEIVRVAKLENIFFIPADFISNLPFSEKVFNTAVLNMGTIGNFNKAMQVKALKELLRVSKKVYFDFYTLNQADLKQRRLMYKQEGWKNVKIIGNNIISRDGLSSISISKDEAKSVCSELNAKVNFHELDTFAVMAEISSKI